MRCANSIDVVLLHHHQVGTDIVHRHCFSLVGVMIMAIHAENGDGTSIHFEKSVMNLDSPKPKT